MTCVLAPLRKEQLSCSSCSRCIQHHDAAAFASIPLRGGFESLRKRAAAAQLSSKDNFPITQRNMGGGGANRSMQLLRFAFVDARGARMNEHSALGCDGLNEIQAQVFPAGGGEDYGCGQDEWRVGDNAGRVTCDV
jgi:hypothetical protein